MDKLLLPAYFYNIFKSKMIQKKIINEIGNVGRPCKQKINNLLDGIFYSVKYGIPWNNLPCNYGSGITIYKYFKKLKKLDVFKDVYKTVLKLCKIDYRKLSIDCTLIKNRYGVNCIGRNHYDRNRNATKISTIVDKNGIPLSTVFSSGNIHDVKLFLETINNLPNDKPVPSNKKPQYILADKGYDDSKIRNYLNQKGYKYRIPVKRNSKKKKSITHNNDNDRIKVENFFSWIRNYRSINIRYDKDISSFIARYYFAISILIYEKIN